MPGMTNLAPRWAAVAILALGIWGMLIAEPYWRAEEAYIVSFGWTLGESVIYDSVAGAWQY